MCHFDPHLHMELNIAFVDGRRRGGKQTMAINFPRLNEE